MKWRFEDVGLSLESTPTSHHDFIFLKIFVRSTVIYLMDSESLYLLLEREQKNARCDGIGSAVQHSFSVSISRNSIKTCNRGMNKFDYHVLLNDDSFASRPMS